MINILRESENSSTTSGAIKQVSSEQKLRTKGKALGDVQNTLHSRPGNLANANTNSILKPTSITSIKQSSNDVVNKQTAADKKVLEAPFEAGKEIIISSPDFEFPIFETHNHKLCEEESPLNDYFEQYKFSEEQMNNLVRSVKVFVTPYSVETFEPCDDIEIEDEKFNDSDMSLSDLLNELVVHEIPAPVEVL